MLSTEDGYRVDAGGFDGGHEAGDEGGEDAEDYRKNIVQRIEDDGEEFEGDEIVVGGERGAGKRIRQRPTEDDAGDGAEGADDE